MSESAATLLSRYFSAPDTHAQQAVLQALGRRGGDPNLRAQDWVPAISALIELLHVARHPRARVDVLEAFAQCVDRPFAVPPLLAELDDPDSRIVQAALAALGKIGVHFAGAALARWLDEQDLDSLESEVLESALIALAETGWPDAAKQVIDAHAQGRITARATHLALAEAVSTELKDAAVALLSDPSAAAAAVLHLTMIGEEVADQLLTEHIVCTDPERSLLLHQLLESQIARKPPSASDLLLEAVAAAHPLRRRRLARRLRARPITEVCAAFTTVAAAVDDPDARQHGNTARSVHWPETDLIAASMAAGIAELQDQVLNHYAGESQLVRYALRHVHSPTPTLHDGLSAWVAHADEWVAVEAVRARVTVWGPDATEMLDSLAHDPRANLRKEWVRMQQNVWMLTRDHRGRLPMDHQRRQRLVTALRRFIRDDPSAGVRERALYVAGNLGLTELADELLATVSGSDDAKLRKAAANSLGELHSDRLVEQLPDALAAETDPEVLFRLARAALATLPVGGPALPRLASAVRTRLDTAQPQLQTPFLALLGRCRDPTAIDLLAELADGQSQVMACVSLTALGELGDPRGLHAILRATGHPDPERQVRAAAALGGIGGEIAIDRLTDLVNARDEEIEVRTAAVDALAACEPGPSAVARLAAIREDDPLALRIVELRLEAARAVTGMDIDEVDARLERAIPGFRASAVHRTAPAGLQALRAAEYHDLLQHDLPPGLDSASAVLMWNKGLEVWLNRLLRPRLIRFADRGGLDALSGLVYGWETRQSRLAPGWRDDLLPGRPGRLWATLARTMRNQLRHRGDVTNRSQSLRVVGGLLLITQPQTDVAGIPQWDLGLDAGEVQTLANQLVALAHGRNPLTHEIAGNPEINAHVRDLALACAAATARIAT